jgi:diketogulonate reductase-like aldo/keto reductase
MFWTEKSITHRKLVRYLPHLITRPLSDAQGTRRNSVGSPTRTAFVDPKGRNWLINFYRRHRVWRFPGVSKPKQAEESAGAQAFRLTEKELRRLEELSR